MKYIDKNKTILVICRDMKDIHLLSRIKHNIMNRYIVASDDIRVHKAIENLSWVNEVCFVEQMESFYTVADDVLRILRKINQWLKSIGDDGHGIPQDLLFWISHCEGGMTTQRIQDILLMIRSYLYLLDNKKVERIIILCSPEYKWEDDVLRRTARSKSIPVHEISRFRFKRLIFQAVALVKMMAHEPYYILKILQSKFLSLACKTEADNPSKEVIFQMFSSADKHVELVAPVMKSMEKIGYHPIAQCWSARVGANKIRQKGLRADEVEKWVSILDILASIYLVLRTLAKALKVKNKFITHHEFCYKEIPLGALLWFSVIYFIWTELGQRYRLKAALNSCFSYHHPVAIKLWGGMSFAEGIIAWKNLMQEQKRKKPLLFNYMLSAVGIKEPYAEKQKDPTELFLASSVSIKEMLEAGSSPKHIVVVGQGRHDDIPKFRAKYSMVGSRTYLKIPGHFKVYLLFDSNYIIRGYLSSQEQFQCVRCLLNFVRENQSVALMIKPHPMHHSGRLEKIIKDYSLENVFLIDKLMLPYHALNAADVLVYKFSTLGYEAMLFEKPGISVILDGESNFKLYKDGTEYIDSTDNLMKLLKKIVDDDTFRHEWIKVRLKKQKDFLEYHFPDNSRPKADLAAEAIDRFLQEKLQINGEASHDT
ncbi:MAG: hypothetical protein PHQ46_12650 [Negativicutes bacterium]|nr:hypothetical protein [Negativicutes bacterium]